ncbi:MULTISPECIES: hypothetical protein [unclassified Nodularia (in: cyanobacteria)]|uniref:hypothetical protein n=1 Tax=unclassified Nodularia (in: cyanobacteria) TaxID=2656917 RepID=UPI001D124C87|nr:hypothetical protein [Nodularia sp. LEGE 04288]MCC2691863.1 hypothetical protein [Nodularia sp. LEGE 04288]
MSLGIPDRLRRGGCQSLLLWLVGKIAILANASDGDEMFFILSCVNLAASLS